MKAVRYPIAVLLAVIIAAAPAAALNKGDKAPYFTLKTIDGKTVSLTSLRKGAKVLLIDFWATNCPPCVAEIPHIQKLYAKYQKQGFRIAGISGYRGDSIQDVKAFIKENKVTYPIPYDAKKSVARQYGLWALPLMYVIDKNGVVKNIHIGYTDPEILESEVKALLK
ncbi:MAG TPA: TlpA disulfide reductase family protein [Armatimonadota bacterium]|nr:TlpA disulfide reductase family protein [Armatimonadota bacterium]